MPSLAVCTWWKSVRKSDFRLLSADVLNARKLLASKTRTMGLATNRPAPLRPEGNQKWQGSVDVYI